MNKIKIAGILLIAGAVAPAMMADTVTLVKGVYSYAGDGEFTATTAPPISLSAYSPFTKNQGGHHDSFQTFCVQTGVTFQPGVAYTYTLSGISLGAPDAPPGSLGNSGPAAPGSPDSYYLTQGVAWLYSHFARGTLGGYDYNNAGGGRAFDAGELQAAIWYLQGDQPIPSSFAPITSGAPGSDPFTAEVIAALGANASATATLTSDYGVQIMNLVGTTANGGTSNYQNQLVLVPDGGSTVILLGAALSGLAMYRRRF